MKITLNGKDVGYSERGGKPNLIGKNIRLLTNGGGAGKYCDDNNMWTLWLYPSFSVPTERKNLSYRPVKDNPFTYVLDITEFVVAGENNLAIDIAASVADIAYIKTVALKGY